MSARSSRSSLVAALALGMTLGACGSKQAKRPDGDPAKIEALAKRMIVNVPVPAAARQCTIGDLLGTQLTITTVLRLAHDPVPERFEYADWVNPPELDAPEARVLLDPKATEEERRAAAGTLLAAKTFIVMKPEMVNVPLALEVKEMKRGALGMRAIGYDAAGTPTCIHVFTVRNDKAVSEWAMDKSDKAIIDPAIAKALRDDLKQQLLKQIEFQRTP